MRKQKQQSKEKDQKYDTHVTDMIMYALYRLKSAPLYHIKHLYPWMGVGLRHTDCQM